MPRRSKGPSYYASRGAYYAKIDGHQHFLATGPEGHPATLKAAWEAFIRIRDGQPADQCNDATPLQTVITRFLQHCEKDLSPGTTALRGLYLRQCLPQLGDTPVRRLTKRAVESWLEGQTAWGRTSRNIFVQSIHTALNWAVEEGDLTANPLRGRLKQHGHRSRGRDVLMLPEEHDAIMSKAKPPLRAALRFLEATGCRPGEMCKLEARYYIREAKVFQLPNDPTHDDAHKTSRSGKHRTIYLDDELATETESMMADHPTGKIFRRRGDLAWTVNHLGMQFAYARDRAKCRPELMPYSYRHTYATFFLMYGGPDGRPGSPQILSELLGTSVMMLQRHYGHLEAFTSGLRQYALDFAARRNSNS